MSYLTVKTLHILSMVLLFGTGLGSAFYKWMADRTGNVQHIVRTNRHVVLADWLFTTPTVIFQLLSGLWLLHLSGVPIATPWVIASLALYAVAGVCWVPVVWLQIRMRQLAQHAATRKLPLPDRYWTYTRVWFWLGVPAFLAMLLVVFVMVGKTVPGGAL
ncbi:MAG: DUF2269 domain-containing protein [Gammaproteobacteria bacterium]|nr:DUF2269 domain-containing protein [Gammaproteobacteria bacterium]